MFQNFLKHHLQLVKCHYKNASTCKRGSTCLGTWGITATIRMNQFAARGAKLNRALVTVWGILTILNTTNVNDILKLLFTLLKFHFKMPLAVTVVNTSLPIVQSCFVILSKEPRQVDPLSLLLAFLVAKIYQCQWHLKAAFLHCWCFNLRVVVFAMAPRIVILSTEPR